MRWKVGEGEGAVGNWGGEGVVGGGLALDVCGWGGGGGDCEV